MPKLEPVELMLKEYRRLTEEIGKALVGRFTILILGLTAVCVLLGLAVKSPQCFWVVPFVAVLTLNLWLSEVRRGQRASHHVWGLERRINVLYNSRILRWEEDLRFPTEKEHGLFRTHYYIIVCLFVAASAFAAYRGALVHLWGNRASLEMCVVVAILVLFPSVPQLTRLHRFDEQDKKWPNRVADEPNSGK